MMHSDYGLRDHRDLVWTLRRYLVATSVVPRVRALPAPESSTDSTGAEQSEASEEYQLFGASDSGSDGDSGWGTELQPGPARIASWKDQVAKAKPTCARELKLQVSHESLQSHESSERGWCSRCGIDFSFRTGCQPCRIAGYEQSRDLGAALVGSSRSRTPEASAAPVGSSEEDAALVHGAVQCYEPREAHELSAAHAPPSLPAPASPPGPVVDSQHMSEEDVRRLLGRDPTGPFLLSATWEPALEPGWDLSPVRTGTNYLSDQELEAELAKFLNGNACLDPPQVLAREDALAKECASSSALSASDMLSSANSSAVIQRGGHVAHGFPAGLKSMSPDEAEAWLRNIQERSSDAHQTEQDRLSSENGEDGEDGEPQAKKPRTGDVAHED